MLRDTKKQVSKAVDIASNTNLSMNTDVKLLDCVTVRTGATVGLSTFYLIQFVKKLNILLPKL